MVSGLLPLTVSTLAVPDDLRHISSQGEEDWDPAYIIHLYPVVTLRNLLPYTVRYLMEVHLRMSTFVRARVAMLRKCLLP